MALRTLVIFLLIGCTAMAPWQTFAAAPPVETKSAAATPPSDPYTALFRAVFDDVDPVFLYFVLIPLTIERVLALRNLFVTVPQAAASVRELWRYPQNRRELLAVKRAMKTFKRNRPELFENLENAAKDYSLRLHQLDVLLRELRDVPAIKKNPSLLREIDLALRTWEEQGDFSAIDGWVARHRKRLLANGKGGAWAQKLDVWKQKEREAARELAFRSNEITGTLNAGLREIERHPTLFTNANNGSYQPGTLYINGNNGMKTADVVQAAHDRCRMLIEVLADKRFQLRGKVGPFGLVNQGYKITSPLFTIGAAGGLVYLHWRAYDNTLRRHGKSPDQAKIEVARQSQIETAVSIKAEASLDGQIAKRADEMKPFTDAVVETLQNNEKKIFAKLKEYIAQNPGTNIDWTKKHMLFMKSSDLAFQVRQAIPFAAQMRIGKDLNMDQLLKFLSLPSKDERVGPMQQRFLNTVFARVLDNIFPELESVREVSDDIITVGAGTLIGTPMRNDLVRETLPGMERMRLVVPPTVAPHPAIPDIVKEPAREAPAAQVPPAMPPADKPEAAGLRDQPIGRRETSQLNPVKPPVPPTGVLVSEGPPVPLRVSSPPPNTPSVR